MTVIAAETSEGLIRWRYLPWALAAIAAPWPGKSTARCRYRVVSVA